MKRRFIILLALFVLIFSSVLAEETELPDITGKWTCIAYQIGEGIFVDSKLVYSQCDMVFEQGSGINTYIHNVWGEGRSMFTWKYAEDHIELEYGYMHARFDFLTQEDLRDLQFEGFVLPELNEDLILRFDDNSGGSVLLFVRTSEAEFMP